MTSDVRLLVISGIPLLTSLPWVLRSAQARRKCRSLGSTTASATLDGRDGAGVDVSIWLELLSAALSTGAAIPRALAACGDAVGGTDGLAVAAAGRNLRLGSSWVEAWQEVPEHLRPIAEALRPAWEEGASPRDVLAAAAEERLRCYRDAARLAAARLGVRLVLPLGVCLLPAFVLVGLVPVLLSLGFGLLTT